MRGRKPETIVAGSSALAELPKPPAWLSKDAKAEWRRVAPILIDERRTLTLADLPSFAAYCTAAGEIIEASKTIAREGMIYQGESGPKRHPAVAMRSDAMNRMRLLANELGLTPVSRSRPAIRDEGGPDDGLSDLGL